MRVANSTDRPPSEPSRQRRSRVVACVVTGVCTVAAVWAGTAAFAGSPPIGTGRPPVVVASPSAGARAADDQPVLREPIGEAVSTSFAGTGPSGDDIFVAVLASSDICVVDQEPVVGSVVASTDGSGLIAVGCGHASEAATSGIGLASPGAGNVPPKITLLLPQGVSSVVFRTASGDSVTEAAENSVAQYAADGLISASYTVPGVGTITVLVPSSSG
jgi:hypothetical protein